MPLEGLDLQHVSILFTQGDLAAITPIYSYTYRVLPEQVSEAAWRQLLYMLGPPGLAIGLLVLLTLSEPRDGGPSGGLLGSLRQTAGNALQQLRAGPSTVPGGMAPAVSKVDGCCQSTIPPLPGQTAAGPCRPSWSTMTVAALCRSNRVDGGMLDSGSIGTPSATDMVWWWKRLPAGAEVWAYACLQSRAGAQSSRRLQALRLAMCLQGGAQAHLEQQPACTH